MRKEHVSRVHGEKCFEVQPLGCGRDLDVDSLQKSKSGKGTCTHQLEVRGGVCVPWAGIVSRKERGGTGLGAVRSALGGSTDISNDMFFQLGRTGVRETSVKLTVQSVFETCGECHAPR